MKNVTVEQFFKDITGHIVYIRWNTADISGWIEIKRMALQNYFIEQKIKSVIYTGGAGPEIWIQTVFSTI